MTLKEWLLNLAPKFLIRQFASPYIAGKRREEAISLVDRLWSERRLYSTVDVLGEAITTVDEVNRATNEYLALIDELGRREYANVSVKLSALGQAIDEELCATNLRLLLEQARHYDRFIRLDMEDHGTVDSTLRLYRRFSGEFPRMGIVLQSRLFRTGPDLAGLVDRKPNIRLCIGIYKEPAHLAWQRKPEMKEEMLKRMKEALLAGCYVALATHDEPIIRRGLAMAREMGKGPADLEIQMLLGVPRANLQQEVQAMGFKVRLYIPYGEHWLPYCMRRLANNPDLAAYVLKNLVVRR